MDVTDRFDVALLKLRRLDGPVPRPLPDRASSACADILAADAAAVSIVAADGFRFPVGVSGPAAAVAEEAQFTADDGPCRRAFVGETAVFADSTELERRFPGFAADLIARTPFRAVASLPMHLGGSRLGAVDLYFRSDSGLRGLARDDSRTVVGLVGEILVGRDPAHSPRWIDATFDSSRNGVMVALGMLDVLAGLEPGAALTLLRSYALAVGSTVDDVARRVVDRTLGVAELTRDRR